MTSKTSNTTGPAVYEVIKSTTEPITGIEVDGKKHLFGKDGAFRVHDAGVAREIDETYGLEGGDKQVTIIKSPVRDSTHRYAFSMPRGDWKSKINWGRKKRVTQKRS